MKAPVRGYARQISGKSSLAQALRYALPDGTR